MANYKYVLEAHKSDGTVDEVEIEVPQGDKGDPGVDVSSAAINDDGHLIITMSNDNTIDAGIAKGKDGFTPSIQVVPDASGWQINFINDNFQTDSIHLKHGYSPQVRVGEISGGHRVYIIAKYTSGEIYEEHFDVMDGEDGKPPAVSIEDIDGGHRVTIGNESFDVMDGRNGDDGGSGLIHILDGAADGSVRTSGATAESASYKLGRNAFAEGSATKASGYYSHAEGSGTVASNYAAHAEGTGTIAAGEDQHVQGRFNVEDADSKYLHIVGNGESNTARSNAHTLDANGNAWFKGKVFVGGTEMDDIDAVELGAGGATDINDLLVENLGFVIPETTLVSDLDSGMMSYMNPLGVTPTEDYTYIVNWNGVEYTCKAMYYEEDGISGYMLGNLGAFGVPGTYTEPFLIILTPDGTPGFYAMILPIDGSSTATISIEAVEYSKIPAPCMPENFPIFFVNLTGSDVSDWVADKTFAETKAAFDSGCMVFFKVPNGLNGASVLPLAATGIMAETGEGFIVFGGAESSSTNAMYIFKADDSFMGYF